MRFLNIFFQPQAKFERSKNTQWMITLTFQCDHPLHNSLVITQIKLNTADLKN